MANQLLAPTSICRNCGSESFNKYCSDCGQKTYTKRFTVKNSFHVLLDAINIERGFFHTLISLFSRPGIVINDYVRGKTKSYYNPLQYLIIIAGINAILVLAFNIFDTALELQNDLLLSNNEAFQSDESLQMQQKWTDFTKKYMNLFPLLVVPFSGLISKWYFNKRKLFYGEHLVITSFIYAQFLAINIVLSFVVLIIPRILTYFQPISMIIGVTYSIYALKRIFKCSSIKAIGGGFSIVFGGIIFFSISFILLLSVIVIMLVILKIDISGLF